jgi:signal transduction histidine kinase
MSRSTAILVGALALVAGLASEHVRQVWLQPLWLPSLDLAIAWLLVGCGLVASVARPNQWAGRWLVVAGFLWIVGAPRQWFPDTGRTDAFFVLDDLNFMLVGWSDVVLAFIGLTYPGRGPATRRDAIAIAALVVAFAAQTLARTVLRLPDVTGSDLVDPALAGTLVGLADVARTFMLTIAGLLVLQRWLRLTGPGRRLLGPVLVASVVSTVVPLYGLWYPLSQFGLIDPINADISVPTFWFVNSLRALVPVAMLVGILRQHGTRGAIADAVASVGQVPSPGSLETALRRALHDPSLRVLRSDEAGRGFIDSDGRPSAHPSADGQRVVTLVPGETGPIAAIVHDRALAEDPTLIEAGVAVTHLVIDNERLTRELRLQLDAVRSSRGRIVAAGDAERRRIERDLHDGVQQRLLAMALALRRAAATVPANTPAATALNRGADEALGVVDDVRELARGIHPAILSEAGLAAALRALADRSPVPVDVDIDLDGDPAPSLASTAYFVASEALANVAKHAGATSARLHADRADRVLRIAVEDDGRGHADPRGAGLRGLEDRVAAIGGTFEVADRPEGGTVVRARIPVE